jgi:hypothetical protein
MENPKSNMVWGIFLIVIGLVFLIGNISRIGMEILWPAFPLTVGLAFWIGYIFDRKNVGLLMPGSILVIVGLLFFYCAIFGWYRMANLWPLFIIAPAVGFISIYFGGSRDSELLIPAGILAGIGIVFLFISHGLGDYWPVLLILAGSFLIVIHLMVKQKSQSSR